jgi:hypothetical protein
MPTQFLSYKKDKGVLSIQISIENIPTWSYRYRFDEIIENDAQKNLVRAHLLRKPGSLLSAEHRWTFLLTNTASFKAPNVIVRIDWYQEQNGQQVKVHHWHPDPVDIDAESGVTVEDRVILNPQ